MPLIVDPDNLGYYLGAAVTPPADYNTGTITTTGSNNTVTGSGTTWTTAMVGRTIYLGTGGSTTANTFVIATVTSATVLTVTSCSVTGSVVNPPALSGVVYNITANVTIDTTGKLIYLRQGNLLSSLGVTLLAVYSKMKVIWANDSTAIKFSFPMTPITSESMLFGNGADVWKPADDTSRQLIRTGGWAEQTSGTSNREYAGVVTLGSLLGTEQVYYTQQSGNVATVRNIVLQGAANQAIQTYGDVSNGNFDYRGYAKVYVRTQARSYAAASLTDIGVTTQTYQVYRYPLASSADANVTDSDVTVAGFGVTVTYYGVAQSVTVGASNYNFHIKIDCNSKNKTQVYEGVQYLLRRGSKFVATDGVTNGTTSFVSASATFTTTAVAGDYISLSGIGTYRIASVTNNTTLVLDTTVAAATGIAYNGGTSIDQFSQVNHDGVANGTTTFTSAAGSFVSGMVGKNITITGKGTYTISSVTNSTTIVLSGSPTSGTTLEYVIGSPFGVINNSLVTLVGGTLTTLQDGSNGTYLVNYLAGDINSIVLTDDTGTLRTYPFTASLTLNFGSNLVADTSAIYRVYYTTNPTGNFGTTTAVLVNDASSSPMSGTVGGSASISKTFSYDTNVDGGRTPGTDAAITVVAIGLNTAQYVLATGTITRSTSNTVSLVAPLERNYVNP